MGKSYKAIKLLQKQECSQSGRTGDVFELLHTFVSIEEPKQKWIYNRIPPIIIPIGSTGFYGKKYF